MNCFHIKLSTLPFFFSLACTSAPSESDIVGTGGDVSTGASGGSSSGGSGGTVAGTGGATTNTGGATSSGGAASGYELVWAEEFDGDGALDTSHWSAENQPAGWVNNELQAYRGFRSENVRKENGFLVIEARRDYDGGTEYSSARIHTQGKHEFLYGRFEARAKLPTAKGSWPAIWMMPSDIFKYATTCSAESGWVAGCNAWPNSGEIDIMEHVGYEVGQVHATIHCADYNWQRPEQVTAQTAVSDVGGSFHVYAMEWSPEKIEAFVDDVKYFSYDNPNKGAGAWPFDQPFYFILNIAVGGSWGGAQGVEPSHFPTKMEVDWVRAYEKTP